MADYAVPYVAKDRWNNPPAIVMQYIDEAAVDFTDNAEDALKMQLLLVGLVRKESNFQRDPHAYVTAASHPGSSVGEGYRTRFYQKIPGSSMTWGQKFPNPKDWHGLGMCQLMPFNMFGSGSHGGLKASDPISKALDVRHNIRSAAKMLMKLKAKLNGKKNDTWGEAFQGYNNRSKKYNNEVATYIKQWKEANDITGDTVLVMR